MEQRRTTVESIASICPCRVGVAAAAADAAASAAAITTMGTPPGPGFLPPPPPAIQATLKTDPVRDRIQRLSLDATWVRGLFVPQGLSFSSFLSSILPSPGRRRWESWKMSRARQEGKGREGEE